MYFSTFALDNPHHLVEGVLILVEEVSDYDGGASADSNHTMYENIRILPSCLNKIKSGRKVLVKLIVFMVLCWNIEIVRNLLA